MPYSLESQIAAASGKLESPASGRLWVWRLVPEEGPIHSYPPGSDRPESCTVRCDLTAVSYGCNRFATARLGKPSPRWLATPAAFIGSDLRMHVLLPAGFEVPRKTWDRADAVGVSEELQHTPAGCPLLEDDNPAGQRIRIRGRDARVLRWEPLSSSLNDTLVRHEDDGSECWYSLHEARRLDGLPLPSRLAAQAIAKARQDTGGGSIR